MAEEDWNNFLNGQNPNQSSVSVADIMGNYSNPNQSLSPLSGFGTNNSGGPIDLVSPNALGNQDTSMLSKFMNSFKNENGSMDFGKIGQGVNMVGNVLGTIMALKQFGMAKDQFNMNKQITTDNHNNNIALAQRQINDIDAMRAADAAAAGLGLPAPKGPQLSNSFNSNSQKSVSNFGGG